MDSSDKAYGSGILAAFAGAAGRAYYGFRPVREAHQLFIFASIAAGEEGVAILKYLLNRYRDMRPVVIYDSDELFSQRGGNQNDDGNQYRLYCSAEKGKISEAFHVAYLTEWIERQSQPVVIGLGNPLFYRFMAVSDAAYHAIEIVMSTAWFHRSLPFLTIIQSRVFPTSILLKDAFDYYREHQVQEKLGDRLHHIETAIPMARSRQSPARNDRLEIIFDAANLSDSRLNLFASLIQKMRHQRVAVRFSAMNALQPEVKDALRGLCSFPVAGEPEELAVLQADVFLTLPLAAQSAFELKKMISMGKAIVATAVDFIPDYVKDGVNGLLVPSGTSAMIVDDCMIALSMLASDPLALLKMQERNLEIAQDRFSAGNIDDAWDRLIHPNPHR